MTEPKFSQLDRNLKRDDPDRLHIADIRKPTQEQITLTEKWILPNVGEIMKGAKYIRSLVDKELSRTIGKLRGTSYKEQYPVGCCGEIRDVFLKHLISNLKNKNIPGIYALQNFIREGGIISKFWGIDKNMYFQNAIQIGSSILDVANDTVDPKKDRVVFYPDLRDPSCPLKNIETLEQYADVAEKYWGFEIYPNFLFPEIAPFYPLLGIRKLKDNGTNERMMLQVMGDPINSMLWRIFFSSTQAKLGDTGDMYAFGQSYDFLTKSRYAEKRLPNYVINQLARESFHRKRIQDPLNLFRINTGEEEVESIFAQVGYNINSPFFAREEELITNMGKKLLRIKDLLFNKTLLIFKQRNGEFKD